MESFSHRLIPFESLFCNCQLIQFFCPPTQVLEGWRLETLLDSILLYLVRFGNLPYNNFTWTTQKTQPFSCWKDVFAAPLHSNRSYLIVVCIFISAGMCLSSRCLAMDIYSDFTVPAFGPHITIVINNDSNNKVCNVFISARNTSYGCVKARSCNTQTREVNYVSGYKFTLVKICTVDL
jgi:hypothetical protein